MNRSKKSIHIISVLCVVLSLALIAGAFFLTRLLRGDVRESSSDIATYRQWSLPEKYSKLLIFPQEVPEKAEEISYYYRYESGYTRPMCQIYFSCRLDEETYAAEVERLAGLSYKRVEGETIPIHYDEASYPYPAFVANEGYDFCYEYAMTDDASQRIICVYAMNTLEDDIKFDTAHLPDYFMEDFTEISVTGLDRFTMYERYQDAQNTDP